MVATVYPTGIPMYCDSFIPAAAQVSYYVIEHTKDSNSGLQGTGTWIHGSGYKLIFCMHAYIQTYTHTYTHTHTHTNACNVVMFVTVSKPVCYERTCYHRWQLRTEAEDVRNKRQWEIFMLQSVLKFPTFQDVSHIACTFSESVISNCHGCNL